MKLKLSNNLTKVEHTYDNVSVTETKLYYDVLFDFNPIGMDEGEYDYTLFNDDEEVIATGILRYGNYNNEKKTVYENKKVIKQYNGR